MFFGSVLFRILFSSFAMISLTTPSLAKAQKCSTGTEYQGPAPISVRLTQTAVPPADQQPSATANLPALFRNMFVKSEATSMTVALANQNGPIWTETQGLKGDEKLHYWASVGKVYTAVIMMQLIEGGQLSFDDKLSRWIKDVPNGNLITIKMLLNHTSGLYSVNEGNDASKVHGKILSLKDNISLLQKRGALFCPGQYWRYSNTGYLFLGAIAERIYGQSLSQIINSQIIDKIGLANTRTVNAQDSIADIAKPRSKDGQKSDIRTPGPAGPIAATSEDILLFWRAFLAGDLVKPTTRDQMLAELFPMFDKKTYYGLGVMAMEAPGADGTPAIWIGHAGGMPGIKAFVMIDPMSRQYVTVALTGDGPASAVAYNMLREWQKFHAR